MTDTVNIERPPVETIHVPIVGTAPLIVHRFSEKAKRQMLDAMQGRSRVKEPKDPEAEFQAALYKLPNDAGFGFPVVGFKAATVGGARFYSKVKMTELRQFLFFTGTTTPDGMMAVIDGTPHMREDVVRVNRGGTDLRYRPEFSEWRTVLTIRYVTSNITRDSVLALLDAGGLGVGVGEWRPERSGTYGTYEVDASRDIKVEG